MYNVGDKIKILPSINDTIHTSEESLKKLIKQTYTIREMRKDNKSVCVNLEEHYKSWNNNFWISIKHIEHANQNDIKYNI